jgi:geranylgeranyl diphosphate synthase type II
MISSESTAGVRLGRTDYADQFEPVLQEFLGRYPKDGMYVPIHDLLGSGGKRIRPAMVLAAAEACGGQIADAMPAALAVELFHNFTLLHDDIMDEAPMRRGRPTAYATWGRDAAILSGDALHAMACEALLDAPAEALEPLLRRFHRTAIEVCEGQQLDMEFESRPDAGAGAVTIERYTEMIRLKTAVLLAASLSMGAMSAAASPEAIYQLYSFGLHLGLAFQLQDDFLDAFGDPARTGKQVGGDILSEKKTYLRIHVFAADPSLDSHNGAKSDLQEKIAFYLDAYKLHGSARALEGGIANEVAQASDALREISNGLPGPDHALSFLTNLAENIATRTS